MPGGYSFIRTWFGRWWGLASNTWLPVDSETGNDSKRETMGVSSQGGSGESSNLFCTRSDGQVCSLRWVSCFHLGFGAAAI